ncbi:MAG: M48 family metallopeptidase [Pontibacterium sp.]
MDFFSQQDKAQRNTRVLVLLFMVAVLVLVALTNLFVALTLWSLEGTEPDAVISLVTQSPVEFFANFDWPRFLLVGLMVVSVIFLACLYKWVQLAGGGKRVAESLGGHRIYPNSEDTDEKRILNVVEEMAIASGMPVPPVYLLAAEQGINAFAAGHTPADAVIGVTRGCIRQLSREQLQGVIAHEFSHILNGDMRLNLRLIAVLHGILFVGSVGELLLRFRSGGRSKGGGQLVLLGFLLLVIGWLGTFFGNLIRASVSRQREFMADASAVQFTRNPQGIADALKVIGGCNQGTAVHNPNTGELSHLFFGPALDKLTGLFATHPPLAERIKRIEPRWNGRYLSAPAPQPNPQQIKEDEQRQRDLKKKQRQEKLMNATVLGAAMAGQDTDPSILFMQGNTSAVQEGLTKLPSYLQAQAREPLGAMAIIFGILLSPADNIRQKQLLYLKQKQTQGLLVLLFKVRTELDTLPVAVHLPLLEMCFPALKCLSAEQYTLFSQRLLLMMRADEKIDLFEWCFYQLIRHYLDPEFGKARLSQFKYKQAQQVADEYQLVISMLAHYGHDNEKDARRAFYRGIGSAGLYNLDLLPDSECELAAFKKAVNKLACCYPALKPRLVAGLVSCVKQDGKIIPIEHAMLRSIVAVMDCPVPDLGP